MVTVARSLVAKLLAPLWRKAEEEEGEEGLITSGVEEIRHLHSGVVTRLCQDYGLIDELVCFTAAEVLGGLSVGAGDQVRAVAVRDRAAGGWRALQVERVTDSWEEAGGKTVDSETSPLKSLIGMVTSCEREGGFINHTTYFPQQALCDVCPGFKPVKGDWVQAQYFVSQTQWASQAKSVAPLRYHRIDQVSVSSVHGRTGVVDDKVFFTLDSLLLPDQYTPGAGDLVTVVVVESSQSMYCWRALCMAPSDRSACARSPVQPAPEWENQSLLLNKGDLEVGTDTDFGRLLLGQGRALQVWIENKGTETRHLQGCEFAGRDPEGQFTLCFPREETVPQEMETPSPPSGPVHMGHLPQRQGFLGGYGPLRRPYLGSVLRPPCSISGGGQCPYPVLRLPGPPGGGEGAAREEVEGGGGPPALDQGPGGRVCEKLSAGPDEAEPAGTTRSEIAIPPGQRVCVSVRCQARSLGRCTEILLLHFPGFTIKRRLQARVGSVEESLLQPASPYCPAQPALRARGAETLTVLPGPAPSRTLRRHLPSFLGHYPVPQRLRDCVWASGDVLVAHPELGQPLSVETLQPRFSVLLWLEELKAERELQEFGLGGAILRKSGDHLQLEVPGVAEGRPSVTVGDKVLLKKLLSGGVQVEYIAYVTEISEEELTLRVNSDFQRSYMGEPLDVEFTFNRLTMRRCHCALEQSRHLGETVLFPSSVVLQPPQWNEDWEEEVGSREATQGDQGTSQSDGRDVRMLLMDMVSVATQTKTDSRPQSRPVPSPGCFFNPALNPQQREAVKRILVGECRPMPYILFGPPGTGKTITLIEAILQVHHRLPSSRVLVCTPSNSAADLLCTRLHYSGFLQGGSLVRLNATCRLEESVAEVLRSYCRAGEDVRQAAFHRVVISTCSSAGMLYQIGLRVGHFTHVFIDEAGQASEPEILIPLGLLSERDGQIVLAGDPCQLGPVVKSRLASAFGLGVSLLERLMERPLYLRDEQRYGKGAAYNPLLVGQASGGSHFRSWLSVMALIAQPPFYNKSETSLGMLYSNRLNRDRWCSSPCFLSASQGTEMREGSNPSWFNPAEAVQAMLYCCQLAKRLYRPIAPSDIGIITPYKKQVEKIRVLLQRVGLMEIKVGSVEEFQGQEFLVIVLSTVRSNEDQLGEDGQGVLGFLANPKRFNVAITRPKALLIIVGNPHVLNKDPCFSALLQYAYDNKAFVGCEAPADLGTQSSCS
uniref:RNA helicase n=1 Tax=Lepisosteus oculatus TaxID=7918 RepID=W5NEM5_LEPOC